MSAPHVEATRYTVSMWPPDSTSVDRPAWDLVVEQRAPGRWAVCHLRRCLAADGTWSVEPIPSERGAEWKARHRFDLGTALRLAREAAPHVVVNGLTAAECAERGMSRQVTPPPTTTPPPPTPTPPTPPPRPPPPPMTLSACCAT